MEKRYVLVTGASGGIGHSIVVKLLENGFTVLGMDLKNDGFEHSEYRFIDADITSKESVMNCLEEVKKITDTLYGIVNTAGIVFMGSLAEEDSELMQRILDVNVAGMARVNRLFFPLIEKQRGRIVNFSSEYGIFCSIPFHGFYTASKHAVECYNDSLRREMNYLGIKVSAIRPGAVDTQMTKNTVPDFEKLLDTTKHFGKTYKKLYPLMTGATKNPLPPEKIAKKVLLALTKKHPKKYYNIHQDIRVKLLSILPAGLTDWIFRMWF